MQHSVITVKWGRKLWNIWKRVDLHNRQPLVSLCSVIDILLWEDFIKSLNVIHFVCLFWRLFKWILNANICISCLFKEVTHKLKSCHYLFTIMSIIMIPVFSVVEHCVSSAKVVGSIPREHTHWQYMYNLNALWIKASAKCINVNVIIIKNNMYAISSVEHKKRGL